MAQTTKITINTFDGDLVNYDIIENHTISKKELEESKHDIDRRKTAIEYEESSHRELWDVIIQAESEAEQRQTVLGTEEGIINHEQVAEVELDCNNI